MKLKIALLSVAMSSAYIFSGSVFAAEKYEIALVAKVNGIPWFNRMGVGVKEAADKLNVNAYQTGPATPDPAQQVKVIEDLIAKEGANKQVISSQADSLIKISRIWADFFPANTSNQPI
ncbi:substrate-binding domain-containing protein, partial [Klebsiella quasipneumoniae subsp. similipneumoniae]|uniref:substrate-binding domain-containing protein n=1 Tax=Klebsiella quasipneumoniae TaxID=1463165 RepID=UPI0038D03174